jgi:EmrB/QacA subfamily drug resistance transporter
VTESARTAHRGLVLAVILIGYLLILIDVSILFAALPTIHRELGFSPTSLSWAQNAYTLTFGGLLLLGARAGDLLGRRRMFMVGIGVFAAASLAVGLAQSPAWMVAARAVQGVGAAILAPSTLALLSTSFPEGPQRTRAMAAYGALAGLGTAFGLIVGGVLTTALSWRLGFLLNVPVGIAAILAAPRVLPETERHPGRLDVFDALSSTAGVSAVVFGIVHSADAGWSDPATIGALAIGAALLAVFVTRQHRAADPLMPLRLFADPVRAGAYAARFLFNGVLVSWFFFMTQYLQGVSGFTPLQAGLAFLPVTGAAFAAAAATSPLTRRVDTRRLTIAACAAMLLGTALTSRVSPTTGYVLGIALPMLVFGVGQGLGLSTLTTAGMAGVAPPDAGVAGALVNVAHHLGGALGLGILITVFEAAGARQHGRHLLADRVSASFTAACVLLVLALVVTLLARPRRRAERPVRGEDAPAVAATASLGPPTGSPASLSSSRSRNHWHGAAANRFSGSPVTRGEHVTDEQYAGGRSA